MSQGAARQDQIAFAKRPETTGNVKASKPMTGEEFLESLRDGREIYIYGERVKDVTTHPAFRNTARMIARLYDALHDPKHKDKLLVPTDTGNGGMTHAYFKCPKTVEESVAGRDAIAEWAKLCYGWLGRAPDYKAAFLGTLGANADFYDPWQENAKRWYRFAQERVPFVNHAIIHPPVDRNRPPQEVGDVYCHVEKETDAGIVVSGAKVVATGSALTNYTFVAHHGLIPVGDKSFAAIFMIPTGAPGVKLICRPSYEMTSTVMGSPFDYPLSSRIDENDAVFIMDKVLVPWENVFCYGDVEKANNFFPQTGFLPRALLHGCTRLAVKLDFIAGAAARRRSRRRAPRTSAACRPTSARCWCGATCSGASPRRWCAIPSPGSATTSCPTSSRPAPTRSPRPWPTPRSSTSSSRRWPRASSISTPRRATSRTRRSAPISTSTCAAPTATAAVDRVKLLKLLWDAVGTEFAGRHELYEINYGGSTEEIRRYVLFGAQAMGTADKLKGFVESCMAEYDLDGWKVPDLTNPGPLSYHAARGPARLGRRRQSAGRALELLRQGPRLPGRLPQPVRRQVGRNSDSVLRRLARSIGAIRLTPIAPYAFTVACAAD